MAGPRRRGSLDKNTALLIAAGVIFVVSLVPIPFVHTASEGGGSGTLLQRLLHRSAPARTNDPQPSSPPTDVTTDLPAGDTTDSQSEQSPSASDTPTGSTGASASSAGSPASGGRQAAAGGTVRHKSSGSCPDVDMSFARGTGEMQGLGVLGTPFASALKSALPGWSVNSYAVNYAADFSQSSAGPGSADMSKHVTSVAASCPYTVFVLGGYSQGASVVDLALGVSGGGLAKGTPIPDNLAPRVAAVVVFGNPLGIMHQTIAGSSPKYGAKAKEFCASGDPVCGSGANGAAHLAYSTNGDVQAAAKFAAGKITGR